MKKKKAYFYIVATHGKEKIPVTIEYYPTYIYLTFVQNRLFISQNPQISSTLYDPFPKHLSSLLSYPHFLPLIQPRLHEERNEIRFEVIEYMYEALDGSESEK